MMTLQINGREHELDVPDDMLGMKRFIVML